MEIPVITIDGPSGSGKGTIAHRLSKKLGWNFLDSGALYRVLAYLVTIDNMSDLEKICDLAKSLPVKFDGHQILYKNQDIEKIIRTETIGNAASKLAANPLIRQALLAGQKAFQIPPGLVADGRDMGTVVFPLAKLKIFLEASVEIRAKRRYNQLQERGIDVSLDALKSEIAERDLRDRTRTVAPLVAADDAIVIDTTDLTAQMVFAVVWKHVATRFGLT